MIFTNNGCFKNLIRQSRQGRCTFTLLVMNAPRILLLKSFFFVYCLEVCTLHNFLSAILKRDWNFITWWGIWPFLKFMKHYLTTFFSVGDEQADQKIVCDWFATSYGEVDKEYHEAYSRQILKEIREHLKENDTKPKVASWFG